MRSGVKFQYPRRQDRLGLRLRAYSSHAFANLALALTHHRQRVGLFFVRVRALMFLGAEKITLAGKAFALRQVHAAMHAAHHVFARDVPMLMWF
jgi:carbonic anhydrase